MTSRRRLSPPRGDEREATPGLERLVRGLCAVPLVALDAVGAGALYLALSTVPRDGLDEDALTGIEVGAFVATACAAASLLLGFTLRRTLRSRWWPVPAVALLVAGAARFAYVEIVHPSG